MLLEEFLRPPGMTPGPALRLSKLFGTTPEFGLNGQRNWDLREAMRSDEARDLDAIEPVAVA